MFKDDFINLGINKGDVVLMHSSMKAINTKATPQQFLQELIDYLGQGGTLLLPALTYSNVTNENPYFNVKETLPCIGLLPNVFMKMNGVVRSLHPTHSVCGYGRYADEITKRHFHDITPVGENSPFRLLPKYNGKILMVGEVLDCCTFMHGVEEVANAPYVLTDYKVTYHITDNSGATTVKEMYRHNFNGYETKYREIKNILSEPDIMVGKIGDATSYLINSNALMKKGTELIKSNPLYFVDEI